MDTIKLCRLHKQGLSSRKIALALQVSKPTVLSWLRKLNLSLNFPSSAIYQLKFIGKKVECRKCKAILPIKEFTQKRQRLTYCKQCHKNQKEDYRKKLNQNIDWYFRDKYNHLKARAKKAGILFDITLAEYLHQFEKQNGKCFYTDDIMEWGTGKGKTPYTASLDKIIPEKGYISGNIVFCTMKANLVKTNLTLQEIEMWLPGWYNRILMEINQ